MSGGLTDRFYGTTIPEHGPGPGTLTVLPREQWQWRDAAPEPRIGVVMMRVSVALDWQRGEAVITGDGGWYGKVVTRQPLPPALVAAKRAELRRAIERRCAAHIRRQAKRRGRS